MLPLCKICKEEVFSGIHLSNGDIIHKSCLNSLQNENKNIEDELFQKKMKLTELKNEIKKRKRLGYKIISIFSKPTLNELQIEEEILEVEENIAQLSKNLVYVQTQLTAIYDYFLTYPPDWEKRREEVIKRDGKYCNKCGNWEYLHLHHIKPLSQGGSNKIENLILLCEDCHSEEHGGRDFSGEFKNSETAFSKRIANIRFAIETGKKIKFSYKKPNEDSYKQRIVKPFELVFIPHEKDNDATLCVRGYCELRKAERTFALKRIRGLKVL